MGLKVKTMRATEAAEQGFDVSRELVASDVWVVIDLGDGGYLGHSPDLEDARQIARWWAS